MSIICRSYDLLFIMAPRTACTALGKLLLDEYDGEYIPDKDILDSNGHFKVQKKHCTFSQLIANKILSDKEASRLIKFTTIRNPFDSIVSLYTKKKYKYSPLLEDPDSWVHKLPDYAEDMKYAQNHSFDAWIFKNYKRSFVKRLSGFKPSIFEMFTGGMDEIIRFENLQEDFRELLDKANISKKLDIPSVNKTTERKKDYKQYYSNFSRKFIEFTFKDDLKKYGYKF